LNEESSLRDLLLESNCLSNLRSQAVSRRRWGQRNCISRLHCPSSQLRRWHLQSWSRPFHLNLWTILQNW